MNYEVIFFAPNGGVGHQLFTAFDEAVAFDRTMLAKGYSTSGVLGSDESADSAEYVELF
jgi:hypothetical protein